ncbi:Hypothetical protein R9X50_00234000 [Acrodontium crateriforme]|uniref:Uncharacterized protein n=1 Tax=Acrodontium crateriforme TaxID=150365 RepID=A0AAQ3R3E6_9PEZI|nr:Hypothetical protein R9X50_00234000 [Acrodontium crateriforme]
MAIPPPPVPMPPPMHDQYNRGPLPPLGPMPVDDWPTYVPEGALENYEDEPKSKKDKKNAPVEVAFEGYYLEKAEPLIGEQLSWQRVGKRAILVDENKLVALVKAHRKRTRTGPTTDFGALTANQQGVVNRLIAERNRDEKEKNAEWILVDVQRFGVWHWSSLEVKKIQVVLKRIDKNSQKGKDKHSSHTSGYQCGEIIDLSDPLPTKKDKKDKKGEKKEYFEQYQPIEDPVGYGQPVDVIYPDDHAHNHQEPYPPAPGPNQPYPPAPMPNQPQQPPYYPQEPLPAPVDRQYPNARPPFQGHPFQPYPDQITPGLYQPTQENWGQLEQPPHDDQHDHQPSARRRSNSARRLKRLENKIDDINERINDWHISSDSSEGRYDQESLFSRPASGVSFTPPSTPPLSPRGSLSRRKSFVRPADDSYYPRSRPRYYDEDRADIYPGYTSRRGRRSGDEARAPRAIEPRYRDGDRRPSLHRAHTYNDYPSGHIAETRYPSQPYRAQRRLTDSAQRYDEHIADFDEQNRRRRDGGRRNSDFEEIYRGRRGSRRQSVGYYR